MKTIRVLICAVLALALLTSSALAFDGLKKGDRGNDVQMLQLRLNELGYSVGKADADYGNKTVKAVESFQSDHGLEATGAVDQATWDALYDEHVVITREGYSADVALTAPFTVIKDDPDSAQTAWMWLDDVSCAADLIFYDNMDNLVSDVSDYLENTRYADAVTKYSASDYEIEKETFEIDGKPAALIMTTFNYKNSGKAVDYFLWGTIELADEGDRKAMVRFNTAYALKPKQESLLTLENIREMLERVTLVDSPAPAQAEPDPILGDWFIQDGTDGITITFSEDGTYSSEFKGMITKASGTWTGDGKSYEMDGGKVRMVLDGDSLTLDYGDETSVYGREHVVAGAEAPAEAEPEAEPDPILGDWYIQDGTDSITMHFYEDGTYSADFEGFDDPAKGTWYADGDGYAMDGGILLMTLDGENMRLGEPNSDDVDIYGRERVEPTTLPAVTGATEEDFLGEWKATGFFMCNAQGMPMFDDNFLEGNETETKVTVSSGSLLLTGLFKYDESYDARIVEDGLLLGDGGEKSTFSYGLMQLLEDGTAEIYLPGVNDYVCLVLERA